MTKRLAHPVFLDIKSEITEIRAESANMIGATDEYNSLTNKSNFQEWMFKTACATAVEKIYSGFEPDT